MNQPRTLALVPAPSPAAPLCLPYCSLHDPHDRSREHSIATARDMLAMFKFCRAIAYHGFEIGEPCVNHPSFGEQPSHLAPNELPRVALSAAPGDCICTVTRIVTHPVDERDDRSGAEPSGTTLEAELAAHWRRFFRVLTRSRAQLSDEMAALLPRGFEDRADIVFRQSRRKDADERAACFYRMLGRRTYRGAPRTAAFVLRLDELGGGRPGYAGTATPNGRSTLAWSHLLSTELVELLAEPCFAMVELSHDPEARTLDPLCGDGWRPRVLVHHRL